MTRRRALACALVSAVLAAGALAGCGQSGDASASPPPGTPDPELPSTSTTVDARGPIRPADRGDRPEPLTHDAVLLLGDSLAAGAHHLTDLEELLLDAGFERAEVVAEAGQDIAWALEELDDLVRVPPVVVVELGTNPGPSPVGFGAEVRMLLRELRRRGAERIAWLTPVHGDDDRYDEKIAVLERVDGIDLLADWASEVEANPRRLASDGLHPSPEGYAELAEFLVDTAVDVDH